MRHVHMISKYKDVVINMDTTYWGRHFGLVIIKDAFRNKVLWHKFVHDEKVCDYLEGIDWLRSNVFKIYGIVCDGMRGLFPALKPYRVQMCQYHISDCPQAPYIPTGPGGLPGTPGHLIPVMSYSGTGLPSGHR